MYRCCLKWGTAASIKKKYVQYTLNAIFKYHISECQAEEYYKRKLTDRHDCVVISEQLQNKGQRKPPIAFTLSENWGTTDVSSSTGNMPWPKWTSSLEKLLIGFDAIKLHSTLRLTLQEQAGDEPLWMHFLLLRYGRKISQAE